MLEQPSELTMLCYGPSLLSATWYLGRCYLGIGAGVLEVFHIDV